MDTPYSFPELMRAFRFKIRVAGKENVAQFASFSGVSMHVDTLQCRDGNDARGVREYIPVLTRYDPVTLSKGVVGDNEFIDWLLSVSADLERGPTGQKPRQDIDVVALDDKGNDAVTWTLKDAMPIGYRMAPLDASHSEVLMESLTFAITGMRRTVRKSG